nr:hypothetical protein [Tanacetum cinerariifolium]
MEVVTIKFSGEGVMLDNKTLLQTGICHDNVLDALGFTLESNELQAEDMPMVPLSATPKLFSRSEILFYENEEWVRQFGEKHDHIP